jgi:hypothetical protein
VSIIDLEIASSCSNDTPWTEKGSGGWRKKNASMLLSFELALSSLHKLKGRKIDFSLLNGN